MALPAQSRDATGNGKLRAGPLSRKFVMPSLQTVERFVEFVEAGRRIDALASFYAEDASMQENGSQPRCGKAALLAHEAAAQDRISEEQFFYDPGLFAQYPALVDTRALFAPPRAAACAGRTCAPRTSKLTVSNATPFASTSSST